VAAGSYSSSSKAVHTQLAGLHATASGDVWAVGWEGLFHSNTERTHIAHGGGTTWQPVESPQPAQWHWPFPLSRTSPLGGAVNFHAYARSISCRRSTPWRPVILTLLVGLGLRNL
jgi:hypothetical protein